MGDSWRVEWRIYPKRNLEGPLRPASSSRQREQGEGMTLAKRENDEVQIGRA